MNEPNENRETARRRRLSTFGRPLLLLILGAALWRLGIPAGLAPAVMAVSTRGLAVDPSGTLYWSDWDTQSVWRIGPDGKPQRVAGGATNGKLGDGTRATEATLGEGGPAGIAIDTAGNLYVADPGYRRVRKVDRHGIVSTVAGNGVEGYGGDGGPATRAQLGDPEDVAVDGQGNLYIADYHNRVRKVDPAGTITTVAGNGQKGYAGDGGPAARAMLAGPTAVAADPHGVLYISDGDNLRVRKVDPEGIISTLTGNGREDFKGDGGPAMRASVSIPWDLCLDEDGELYIADVLNCRVRKVDRLGVITTVAGNGDVGQMVDGQPATRTRIAVQCIAAGLDGSLYLSGPADRAIFRVDRRGYLWRVVAPEGRFEYALPWWVRSRWRRFVRLQVP